MMKFDTKTKLRLLRLIHGFSQEEVAEQLKVTQQLIALYENGRRKISDENKIKLARFYNLDIDTLFYDKDFINFMEKVVESQKIK